MDTRKPEYDDNRMMDRNAARIDTLTQLYEQRAQANQEALKAALAANDQRLAGMNEFRAAINDTTNKMMTRIEALSVIGASTAKIDADVSLMRDRIDIMGRPNYPLLVGIISIVATLVTGIWLIIGLRIDTAITPNAVAIASLQERDREQRTNLDTTTTAAMASTQSDVVSRSDRSQLNSRVLGLETLMASGQADRRASDASVKQQLVEIETQFKATSDTINMQKDAVEQWITLLWMKVYNEKLPTTNFRPNLYRN